MDNWEKIHSAFVMVSTGVAKRIDGDGFIVYKVGNIVRIDIKVVDG